MSQAGELYVDVGVRGLGQAQRGLDQLRGRLDATGESGRGLAGRLSGSLAGIGSRLASLGRVATASLGGIVAGTGAAAVGVTALLSEMGRAEDAGAALQGITTAWDAMWSRLREIGMEFGELIARVFGIQSGIEGITEYLSAAWEEWKPTVLAALDLVKMVWDGIWSVVLTAVDGILSLIDGLFGALGISLRDSGQSWAETVRGWIESVLFFTENWRLYVDLWWERLKLFASNSWERIKAFGQNLVEVGRWLWDNWREIFETLGNFIGAVFRNAGENIRRIWTSVTDWISGKGWDPPDLKPLTEGFRNTIKEMPRFVEANVRESNERIDALMSELDRRRAQFDASRRARDQQMLAELRQTPAQQTAVAQSPREERYGFVGFADLARQQQESIIRQLAERQAKAAEQTAAGVAGLVDLAKNAGIRVTGTGVAARYQ
jgi:hypothetical protein